MSEPTGYSTAERVHAGRDIVGLHPREIGPEITDEAFRRAVEFRLEAWTEDVVLLGSRMTSVSGIHRGDDLPRPVRGL